MAKSLARWSNSILHILIPQHCAMCGDLLDVNEKSICTSCYMSLPFTHIKGVKDNWLERFCWGQLPVRRANAFLKYLPSTDSRMPFIALKYQNRPDIGVYLGRMMAAELCDTDFFSSIDFIVPVPLAEDRLLKRKYNQSTELAKGVSQIVGIPIREDFVKRTVSNVSQTQLTTAQRRQNVKGIFRCATDNVPPGSHILLVDDIFTTGSTLFACAHAFDGIPNVCFSILVLGVSRQHPYYSALDSQLDEDALAPDL